MAKIKDKSKVSVNNESRRTMESAAVSSESQRLIENTREAINRTQSPSVDGKDSTEIKEKIKANQILKEIERLYSPDNFKPLVKAPNDVMLALTGNSEIWNITDNEVSTMAHSASVSARYFMTTDPKWVALSMFFMSVATIYGTRAGLQIKEYLKSKHKKENRPPNE